MRINKIETPKETLQDAMLKFLNYKRAQKISERTMRDYDYYLNDFLVNSQNSLDEKILITDLLTYFANIPDTSPARFNHPYQNLSCLFNWCVKMDILNVNPLIKTGLHKKRDDGNIKPASIDDVKALLNSWNKSTFAGMRNYIITLLMLDTGIRTSELRRLIDDDFDADTKQITINKYISKTKKKRVVFLSDSTAKQLSKFIKVKPEGWCNLIFPTREGKEMTSEGMAREFDRQCEKIGVKFTPYQLRHTFASYFVANGGDIFTLQELMGHADIRMTRRYTEIDNTTKQKQHSAYTPINALQSSSRIVKI